MDAGASPPRRDGPGAVPSPGPWRRIGWLVLLWCGSVLALGVVAILIRLLMHLAGMRPA